MLTEMRRECWDPRREAGRDRRRDPAALVPGRDAGLSDPGALHRQDHGRRPTQDGQI